MSKRWASPVRWSSMWTWLGTRPVFAPRRRPQTRVLVELALFGPSGTAWFSDGYYVDAQAGIAAEPRIVGPVSYRRTASTPFRNGSGRATVGVGAIELSSVDGGLDWLTAQTLRGTVVRLYVGPDNAPVSGLTRVARCVVDDVQPGERSVRLVLADASRELAVPVVSTSVPSGANGGALVGCVWGYCFSVPLLQWSPPTLQYAIQDTAPLATIWTIADRGVTLTPSTQWTALTAGPIYGVQLNQAVAGKLTATVTGPFTTAYDALTTFLHWACATRCGLPGSRLDIAGWQALYTELAPSGGLAFGEYVTSGTWDQVFDRVAGSFGGWWWIDPAGVVRFDRLRPPAGTPVLELDERSFDAADIQLAFDDAPGLSGAVLEGRNWVQLSETDLADSLKGTAAGVEQTRQFRGRTPINLHPVYQRELARRGATEDAGMPTSITFDVNATEAARREALYGEPRFDWVVPVLLDDAATAATLPLGAVVSLRMPRWGCDDGRLLRVIDVDVPDLRSGQVRLGLWGGGPEELAP
jgi:hypothetical protein